MGGNSSDRDEGNLQSVSQSRALVQELPPVSAQIAGRGTMPGQSRSKVPHAEGSGELPVGRLARDGFWLRIH